MSKKKTHHPHVPSRSHTPSSTSNRNAKDASAARKFFIIFAVVTVLLVILLYFAFVN